MLHFIDIHWIRGIIFQGTSFYVHTMYQFWDKDLENMYTSLNIFVIIYDIYTVKKYNKLSEKR